MDFGNKEIFGGFYTGDRDLFDTNGAIIDMSGKSDIEIQKLIEDNYFNKKYMGPVLKKDIDTQLEEATQPGAATFEERISVLNQFNSLKALMGPANIGKDGQLIGISDVAESSWFTGS